jgi:hypothetical protein
MLEGRTRETPIRRDAEGRWFHDGDQLEHEKLIRAFDSWIARAEDGRWCLKNDINWAYFKLEGAPYFVRSVRLEGRLAFLTLSDAVEVPLDLHSLREGPDAALYCDGYPGLAARFDRSAAAQLGELLEEDTVGPYFAEGEERVRPPQVDEPLGDG